MGLAIRTVLTWLLVLALPVQGFAASSMLLCGTSLGRQNAVMVTHDRAVTATHHPAAMAGHDHAAMMAAAAVASASGQAEALPVLAPAHGTSGADAAAVKADDPSGAKCSVCAACCHAAAMVSAALVLDIIPAAPSYGAMAAAPQAVFEPSGLERPPRTILA